MRGLSGDKEDVGMRGCDDGDGVLQKEAETEGEMGKRGTLVVEIRQQDFEIPEGLSELKV